MAKSPLFPTDKQKKWIVNNYKKYKNEILGQKLNIPKWKVSKWLKYCGVKKIEWERGRKKPRYVKRNPPPEKPKEIKWLNPREYSNVTREQHVERILSIKL